MHINTDPMGYWSTPVPSTVTTVEEFDKNGTLVKRTVTRQETTRTRQPVIGGSYSY